MRIENTTSLEEPDRAHVDGGVECARRHNALLCASLLFALAVSACATDSKAAGTTAPLTITVADSQAQTPESIVDTTAASSNDTWVSDLELIDASVRNLHADPFAVVPESEWNAKVAELEESFSTLNNDERIVGMASLAGLLDTHTQYFGPDQRVYDVWLYRFSDGMFVVAAKDPTLIGARLVSINGVDAAEVEARIRPLVPGDNESAKLNGLWMTPQVDFLHGLGIVDDPAKPGFAFAMPDGTERTIDLATSDIDEFAEQQHLLGSLAGDENEAVRRRSEPIWSRVDPLTKAFLLSVNDYSTTGSVEALAAMTTALDNGTAEHVVVDMRYLRGGDGSQLLPMVDALESDQRVNRPGGLTVLIGRENESAATSIASMLDLGSQASFVGEMTPARADNFLCPCTDVDLPQSGFIFSVPTSRSGNGDPRTGDRTRRPGRAQQR